MEAARITSFLVKVASRCNLDCDYCYVYHHADQGWRKQPKLLSLAVRVAFADRLAEYARTSGLKRFLVVLHGGEPLLAGADGLVAFAEEMRGGLGSEIRVDIGMQTNGLLLTDAVLDQLEDARISVSISLDGPREANDLHRNSRRGRSSFDRVSAALERLKLRPSIFAGIIAVIDPRISPSDILSFFDSHRPPKLDFLLPDAHHLRPPPGRAEAVDSYRNWLLEAFDLWFDRYPHLPVRTFEALLDAAAGLPSGTDAFGLGDVSLISVETDGTYHDLDVLKIVRDGGTKLSGSVRDTPIAEVARSPSLAEHRRLLTKEGLCVTCRLCPAVDVCGGGSLPHRFGLNGFDNPSVYCSELFALIAHVRSRLAASLNSDGTRCIRQLPAVFDLPAFELAETSGPGLGILLEDARRSNSENLRVVLFRIANETGQHASLAGEILLLPSDKFDWIASEPGTVVWARILSAAAAGRTVHDVDGAPLEADHRYLEFLQGRVSTAPALAIGVDDKWLRLPFDKAIEFESEGVAVAARPLVERALTIISAWRPALSSEIQQTCRAIQFVRDPAAHPEKIVSFSDNSLPGALYVSVVRGDMPIDEFDLADSLVHEHRHQKLYLLERFEPMVAPSASLVVSPWREDLRPPSGLLHAIFVFVELQRFWTYVLEAGPPRMRLRASNQLRDTAEHLDEAFNTIRASPLTATGRKLVDVLDTVRVRRPVQAPG